MKIIAVFTENKDIVEYFRKKPDWGEAYQELSQEIYTKGGKLYMVGPQENYIGHATFSKGLCFTKDGWLEEKNITADIVFVKATFCSDGAVKLFNDEHVTSICTDKWKMYKTFPSLCPLTYKAEDYDELQSSIKKIATPLVVIKPLAGAEGEDVLILEKTNNIELKKPHQFPMLVQEFLDSSVGIPDITRGLHDFRVAILNGEIMYSYYRTPPEGSYRANVSQGGRFQVVPVEKIPTLALEIVQKVEEVMEQSQQRFYGIDMAFTPEGVKIIEMNSKLGLLPNKDGREFIKLKEKLAETLLSLT